MNSRRPRIKINDLTVFIVNEVHVVSGVKTHLTLHARTAASDIKIVM